MGFVREHTLLCAATAPAFLSAKFFEASALSISTAFLARFNFIEQEFAREKSVQALLARVLTLYLQSSRPMHQHHTCGGLVDVLTAMTTRAHERFFNVRLAHTKRRHALRELIFFFETDGK